MKIVIYTGDGATPETIEHMVCTIEQLYPYPENSILKLNGFNIRTGQLDETIDLIIFPGGITTKMVDDLGRQGCKAVREFVENGGKYFGVCAGAYLACERVSFKTASHNIQKNRPLKFFKGTCKGPLNGQFHETENIGAEITSINLKGQIMPLHTYINGGGHFINASRKEGVNVLATFATGEAAVIECQYGMGKVLLSSVHLEYQPQLLRPCSVPKVGTVSLFELAHERALEETRNMINHLFK